MDEQDYLRELANVELEITQEKKAKEEAAQIELADLLDINESADAYSHLMSTNGSEMEKKQ